MTTTTDPTGHTCLTGPLCGQMTRYLDVMSSYAEDPISREYGIYPEPPADLADCDHDSCRELVYAPCFACQIEAMDEAELLPGLGPRHHEDPARYADDRAETEPCERGTVGCSVRHGNRDTDCEPW